MYQTDFSKIPDGYIDKWQAIANLLANLISIPAALIMKTENEYMEVLISSQTDDNPYHPGDKEPCYGLYCETVIKNQDALLVENALNSEKWNKNPDIKLGMIAYLGLPVNFPDNTPFGTICVLDNKENSFASEHIQLLQQFRNVIELDLALIQAMNVDPKNGHLSIINELVKMNRELSDATLRQQENEYMYQQANEEYQMINEELRLSNEDLLTAKLRAEQSENQFRALVENAPKPIFIQVDWKFAYVNKAAVKLYGADDQSALLGTKILNRIHPDFVHLVDQRIDQLNNRSKAVDNLHYKHLKLDNTEIEVEVSAVPIVYEDKNGALVFVEDVGERRRLENERNKSLDLLNNLAKQVPGVIYQYRLYPDGHSEFPYSSPGIWEIYEVTPEEVSRDAAAVFTRIHPDDYDFIVETIMESARNQTPYTSDFRVILPEQGLRWRHCDAQPELLEDGSTLWHGIISDITDFKNSVRALQHSHELLEYIIEHNRSSIAIHDNNLRYIYVSQSYLRDYNIHDKEIIGKHHYEIFPDLPERWKEVHQRALKGEVLSADEDYFPREDGTESWTRWECRPWYSADGSIGGIVIYSEVITERKLMELELKAAKEKAEESDRLKSSFLQNMSHEVRTPLNAISGFSRLMAKPDLPAEKLMKFSDIITNSSNKLIGIITDVIEISQVQAGQLKATITEFDANQLIVETIADFQSLARERNVNLTGPQSNGKNRLLVHADRLKLKRIVLHLIDNAIKFTENGTVEIGCQLTNRVLNLSVSDSGIGISPKMQQVIFEPFRQVETGIIRNYGGNGLGLSLVKAYVELMNGTISLQSELGKGTTFLISIPDDKRNAPEQEPLEERKEFEVSTILIAEDEYSNFQLLQELLSETNVKILYAADGQQALNICLENKVIDLILMDIKMPIMDGHTASKRIKELRPDLPIIAQTAYALESERSAFINDFDGYITKPIKKSELAQKLKKYFVLL